ncbi:hypothetical protein BJY04DRAFT_185473 [Aspergillus karnatakaensis]|uniref:uncharacterized protein n=1 Tax=Aspergillus karnatakaensis TaxID=1810916 RepID=UPI003CCD9AC6
MVKIALAGGSGNVASEIIDALVATGKHEIVILTRKDVDSKKGPDGITWVKANYEETNQLTQALQGVHTVLSFVTEQESQTSPIQRRLIDAAVQAGVKRFAPSEWASSKTAHLPWYAYKADIRGYLAELNKDKKVLEYTLFQPGLFTNYLAKPYQTTKHITLIQGTIDFENCRAIILEGGENGYITLTTVHDFATVVAKAVEYEGEWPVASGIRGTRITIGDVIKLGERVRGGKPFNVEKVKAEDFESGNWKTSWIPWVDHPSIPKDQIEVFSRFGTAGMAMGFAKGSFDASDEWNQLLPDYKFTQAQDFLEEVWKGKP